MFRPARRVRPSMIPQTVVDPGPPCRPELCAALHRGGSARVRLNQPVTKQHNTHGAAAPNPSGNKRATTLDTKRVREQGTGDFDVVLAPGFVRLVGYVGPSTDDPAPLH